MHGYGGREHRGGAVQGEVRHLPRSPAVARAERRSRHRPRRDRARARSRRPLPRLPTAHQGRARARRPGPAPCVGRQTLRPFATHRAHAARAGDVGSSGHAERIVPIDPRLTVLLQQRFDAPAQKEVRLLSIPSPSGQRRRVDRILAQAMVQPWADCWQTLRRSCEIEWAQTHPQYAVSRWIGHSISVSGRHYANSIPDELFDRASGLKGGTQKGVQSGAESPRTDAHGQKSSASNDASKPLFCRSKREGAHVCATSQNGAGGNRTPVPRRSAASFYVCIR